MAPSRLKFSRSTARARHRDWKSHVAQCLFRTSGGGPLATRDRRDCFDDLSRFLEVIGNPDGPDAVAFAINDFPDDGISPVACWIAKAPKQTRSSSDWSRLFPGRKEGRHKVVTKFRSLVPADYPRDAGWLQAYHAVSQSTNSVGIARRGHIRPQVIERYYVGRSWLEVFARAGLVRR